MTAALLHHDERNFPESKVFKPERWVGERGKALERHLVAFSGGSRICLGLNLAEAELFLAFSAVLGNFGGRGTTEGVSRDEGTWIVEGEKGVLELTGTDVGDVEMCGDGFFPLVKEGSQGVRVLVRS